MTLFAERRHAGALPVDAAGWLGLAAAPAFALMAWISAAGASGMAICSATTGLAPIDDMALMYLLMSMFHLPPWMRLLPACSRRRANRIT